MSLESPLFILFLYSYFEYFTYFYTCHVFIFHACYMSFQCSYSLSGYIACLQSMSFSSFGSMIYCILHYHTCTIVYFPVICVHLVLFISCYPVLFLYFIYICTFLFYLSYTLCFCIFSVLFLCLYTYFHIKLYYISCSCNCLYFHRIAMLCFSYHVIYFIHIISF